MSNTDADDEQIYVSAGRCAILFQQLLIQSAHGNGWLYANARDHNLRFEHWVDFIGAFADEQVALDSRLGLYPDARELVLQMLEMLETNLHHALRFGAQIAGIDTTVKPTSGEDQSESLPEVKSLVLALTAGSHPEEPKHDDDRNILSANLASQAALSAIQEAIDRLHRLAVNVRTSSTLHFGSRVKNSALKTDVVDKAEFERLILLRINAILPSLSDSLVKQLMASISFRRFRLMYQRRHQNKLGSRSFGFPREDLSCGHREQDSVLVKPFIEEFGTNYKIQKSDANSGTIHSGFDIAYHQIHQPERPSKNGLDKTTVKSVTQGYSYPRAPKVTKEGAESCPCDWCFEEVQASQLEIPGWWRSHFKKDLQPYVCISEDCMEPAVYFASFSQWSKHMDDVHTVDWARKIHNDQVWYCDFEPGEYHKFSSADELYQHIKTCHPTSFTETQISRRLTRSVLSSPRRPNICPLCKQNVQDMNTLPQTRDNVMYELSERGKPTKQPKRVGFQAPEGGFSSDEGTSLEQPMLPLTESEMDSNEQIRDDAISTNHQRIAMHVASHLKSLAFLSIRYIDDEPASKKSEDAVLQVRTSEAEQDEFSDSLSVSDGPLSFKDISLDERSIRSLNIHDELAGEKFTSDGVKFNRPSFLDNDSSSDDESFQFEGHSLPENAIGGDDNHKLPPGVIRQQIRTEKTFNPLDAHVDPGEVNILRWVREKMLLKRLYTSNYRQNKDRYPNRVPGTCEWFVSHALFREWQKSEYSRVLWLSADAGLGKSVLMKYLIDSVLPSTDSTTTCYFFFNNDIAEQRDAVGALHCILYQLFFQKPILLSDTILDKLYNGDQKLNSSFGELWQILVDAGNAENAGKIICLLDAFDECEDQGRLQLTQALCQANGINTSLKLKFLVASRTNDQIARCFGTRRSSELQIMHLSGEADVIMKNINSDIDTFINTRVHEIGSQLRLSVQEEDFLLDQLLLIPNRTYLWADLALKFITDEISISRMATIQRTLNVPKALDEIYEKTLCKSPDFTRIRKTLHIAIAAVRPLTMGEFDLALNFREFYSSYFEIFQYYDNDFDRQKRYGRGSLLTVVDSKIYLLHSTVRDFLLETDTMDARYNSKENKWKHSFRLKESHRILSDICIWYLLLPEVEAGTFGGEFKNRFDQAYSFLEYSAKHWVTHFQKSQFRKKDVMTQSVLRICDAGSRSCMTWLKIYWQSTNTEFPRGLTTLMIASYFGLGIVVESLLRMDGIELNRQDDTYRRSALSWAAGNGFEMVVKLLIENSDIRPGKPGKIFEESLKVDVVDRYGRTPLATAASNGHEEVVKLLLNTGKADVNFKDQNGQTPLAIAAVNGYEGVIKLLLNTGMADTNATDQNGQTPLAIAITKGHEGVIKLLPVIGQASSQYRSG